MSLAGPELIGRVDKHPGGERRHVTTVHVVRVTNTAMSATRGGDAGGRRARPLAAERFDGEILRRSTRAA